MGLRLSPEKTLVTHVDDGLDFLGWRIQRPARANELRADRDGEALWAHGAAASAARTHGPPRIGRGRPSLCYLKTKLKSLSGVGTPVGNCRFFNMVLAVNQVLDLELDMASRSGVSAERGTLTKPVPRVRTRTVADAPARAKLTVRGQRTRAKLITAARAIFGRDGFLEARITDIADRAGVAHGSFYTYFASKEEIFQAVAEQMVTEYTPADTSVEGASPFALISEANRRYWQAFQANIGLFEALDQVSSFSSLGRTIRRELRHGYEGVAYERIRAWQKAGLAADDIDPHLAAIALTALVGRFVQVCLALEDPSKDQPIPQDQALSLLNTLYARALGISPSVSKLDSASAEARGA
jgi:AcrR family transcriptional regulator